MTDYGETLWNLEQLGIDLTSHKTKKYQFLKNIIESNNLVLENKKIQQYIDRKKLPQAIHDYVLAISEISNLAILKKDNIKSLFRDEVIQYFLKIVRLIQTSSLSLKLKVNQSSLITLRQFFQVKPQNM